MTGKPFGKNANLLDQLQSVAAPGAVFARSGNVKNAYLQVGTVASNTTGFPIRLTGAELILITVTNDDNAATFSVEIYEYDGTTETLLDTIDVVADRGSDYVPASPISVTFGTELRAKVNDTGSADNPVVIVFTTGEVPV